MLDLIEIDIPLEDFGVDDRKLSTERGVSEEALRLLPLACRFYSIFAAQTSLAHTYSWLGIGTSDEDNDTADKVECFIEHFAEHVRDVLSAEGEAAILNHLRSKLSALSAEPVTPNADRLVTCPETDSRHVA